MIKKLKILHVNTGDNGGGASDFALSMINRSEVDAKLIVGTKFTSSKNVIPFHKNIIDKTFMLGDKILWKTGYKKSIKNIFSITENFNKTYLKLRNIREYIDADIIHLHNIHGSFFDLNSLEKINKEKPIIWSLHDMWAMTGGEAFTFENENYKYGQGFTPYHKNYPLNNPLIDRRQYFLDFKKNIYSKIAKKTIFVPGSYWLANCLYSSFVFNNDMQIEVIHESIDTTTFYNNNQRNWNVPRVLIINIQNPFKGNFIFNDLFITFKQNIDLYIIGDPLLINNNKLNIKQLPFFANMLDLAELFNNIDIFVFPSLAENFALTTLMAMSCGVCVLASDIGGLNEQLGNEFGILFNPNFPEEILTKLESAVINISQSRDVGKAASLKVKQSYDIKKMIMKYKTLYLKLLNQTYS